MELHLQSVHMLLPPRLPLSPRDADEGPGAAELPGGAQRRRRPDGAGLHDGRVPPGPSAGQDGHRQLRVQLLQRDPLHYCHAVR